MAQRATFQILNLLTHACIALRFEVADPKYLATRISFADP